MDVAQGSRHVLSLISCSIVHDFTCVHIKEPDSTHLALDFVDAWEPLRRPVRQTVLQYMHAQGQRKQRAQACEMFSQQAGVRDLHVCTRTHTHTKAKSIYLATLFVHAQEQLRERNRRERLRVLRFTYAQRQPNSTGA